MNKWLVASILIAIVAVSSIGGVYFFALNPQGTPETRTIIDSTGTSVEVPADVQRVVALRSGIVEMMVVLGAEDKLVAIDDYTAGGTGFGAYIASCCPQLMDLTVPVSGRSINLEEIVALEPDVVFVGGYGRLSWVDPLREADLTVVVAHFEEIGNFTRDLNIIAEVVGKEDKADTVASYIQSVLDKVDSTVGDVSAGDQIKAYFCSHDAFHVYGGTTFEHAQIVTAKGINVGAELTTWLPEVSSEQLLVWNPDVIFTLTGTSIDDILNDGRIQDVSAIKTGKVYAMPEDGWDFGSLRAILAIEYMASKFYPDKFSGIDMNQEANDFYQTVYGIDYTGPAL
ncbi:MAG: ABC transporter substrate-binding protein [Candidatus Bathyarchaeota archaeon]|nr:ABC transporter substrate-binding protein [Candidatus Bathyarchaeota archaeon]